MNNFIPFYEKSNYKDAHISKINLPDKVADKLLAWYKNPKSILFFAGNPGCGKSYFIAAFIHDLIEKKYMDWRYMPEREFYAKMRETIENGWDYIKEIKRLCENEIFMLDDIGTCQSTEFQKECLQAFIDERSETNKPTIITSNMFLDEIAIKYHPRLVSRLKDKRNTVIELNWIDKRQT